MKIKNLKRIIIATGGTGGHIFPACGLAQHFLKKGLDVQIISDKRGLKFLDHNRNLKIKTIDTSTLNKKNLFQLIISLLKIVLSVLRSLFYMLFNRPNLVFGMGGYSSFPVCVSSIILRIPLIIYENNLFIGKANKYLLPFANKIFVSCSELEGITIKYEKKIAEIGNILRDEIFNITKKNNLNHDEEELRILVLGGSQAAKVFADKVPDVIEKCIQTNIKLKIYQQCLPHQVEILTKTYKNLKLDFEVFSFKPNILDYFTKANLAITRAGSSILAELTNANIPFISVPLPSSADNHQLKNAIHYVKKGCSYLVEEKNLDDELFELIQKIFNDTKILKQFKDKQGQYSDKSVYINIDKQLENLIK